MLFLFLKFLKKTAYYAKQKDITFPKIEICKSYRMNHTLYHIADFPIRKILIT